ncbi:hypothetical protein [Planococcus maritimus]|uniref:hypothetical protein n=1 Tax=Planococcus maritimus TaxID=192421 RepID=UPI00079375BF|nr:hypothetical protein [Planococcus maritimus]KYG59907.1 hypothetical protein AY633_06650 [Planococcus maritimus]
MTEEKKMQYVHLTLCKVAMLLFGLNLVRTLSIHHDQLGFLVGFIGYSLVSIHVRSLEKKWEIPKKHVWISLGIFALIFLPLAYWLAFPR